MKRTVCLILAFLLTAGLAGCGTNDNNPPTNESGAATAQTETHKENSSDIDVDLTKLSSTMVYAEVYNMMTNPKDYMRKTVKMQGNFSVYHDDMTGKYYYACLIADATACCAQGIEFVLKDARAYPDEYPKLGSVITVTGTFDTYYEGAYMYCQLIHAELQ